MIKKLMHYLFHCPTFWRIQPAFQCPNCKVRYRCYWDGNDIDGVGINYCDACAYELTYFDTDHDGPDHD